MTYERKLQEYKPLIKYAARRYSIPGVAGAEADDLYQEGCLILDWMVRHSQFEVDSHDFRKMFKTKLWHGLADTLKSHKRKKNDYRKVVYYEQRREDLDGEAQAKELSAQDLETSLQSIRGSERDPEQAALDYEQMLKVERFIEILTARLDSDARKMFYELLYPKSWDEIPEEYHRTSQGDVHWRKPRKKIPQHVIADMLGWSVMRVRRSTGRLRREAAAVAEELGFEGVALFTKGKS